MDNLGLADIVTKGLQLGLKWSEIADKAGWKTHSLRGWASKHRLTRKDVIPEKPTYSQRVSLLRTNLEIGIPDAVNLHVEAPLRIYDGDALVLGDLHFPHHNKLMLIRAINLLAQRFPHIKRIIFGGDTFDFSKISQHPHTSREAGTSETIRLGGDVLRVVLKLFEEAIFLNGNHDERVAKKMDDAWDLELLINAALGQYWPDNCDVKVSNLDYLLVDHPERQWVIGHPSHYSGQGGKTPSDLADVWGRNVITFHNHVCGESPSKSGNFVGIDAGCMTVAEQHSYQNRRLTKFTRWQCGFVVLSDGYAYRFTENFTDWKALGAA